MDQKGEELWNELASKLRKMKGLAPLTPEEAEKAFAEAEAIPMSDEEIERIVDHVMKESQKMDSRIEAMGYQGKPIVCTKEEWHSGLRDAVQKQAGEWIDNGADIRAQMALLHHVIDDSFYLLIAHGDRFGLSEGFLRFLWCQRS